MRHIGVDLNRGHALLDRALHTKEANTHLVFHQLTHGANTTVAEVIDIVNLALTIFELMEVFHNREDVRFLQNAELVFRLQIEAAIHLHTAHRG